MKIIQTDLERVEKFKAKIFKVECYALCSTQPAYSTRHITNRKQLVPDQDQIEASDRTRTNTN